MPRYEKLIVSNLVIASPSGRMVEVFANDGTPTDGTSGTHAGDADTGSLCADATNGVLYQNTNTKASPLWTKVGIQST